MTFLMIDFVNLKIKSVQYFECTHKVKGCVFICIHRCEHSCVYEDICLYYIFKKVERI
jgi:hypothetical protein